MTEGTSLTGLRERLVAEVLQTSGIGDERIAAALRDVPRHLFLPHLPPQDAYLDDAIVTKRDADGQPISSSSQPAIMAIMLDQLTLAPGQRVLEIGAGTGYNAALMRHIVGSAGTVISVDIDADLVGRAREHLASAGYPDVTVVAADGADGYPAGAPYDRVIATVGVSDLAPAWLDQAGPGARIVVPLDVRGSQLAVAFGRSGSGGHWVSRSIAPCGFMRMRGSLASPERTVVLQPGLSVMLPDGLTLADGHEVDGAALAAFMAEPPAGFGTGVRTSSVQVFWGLGLWLATHDSRSCGVTEELAAGDDSGRLARAPLGGAGMAATAGIVDSGGIAVLTADGMVPAPGPRPGQLALAVAGFGPHGAELGAALAAHVQAWDAAGQPGAARLHVDAYPRSSADEPAPSTAGRCPADRAVRDALRGLPHVTRADTVDALAAVWVALDVTSSKGDHLETEQKYDADADFVLPKLGSLPDLGGKRLAEPRRIYLSATYFDTEDLALIQHKVTLRRRVGGDDEGWHLKLPVRKDTRQELHVPLDEGARRQRARPGWPIRLRTSRQVSHCVRSPSSIPNGPW